MRRARIAIVLALQLALAATALASNLAVLSDGEWKTWWSSESAPARWTAPDPILMEAAAWTPVRAGVDTADLRIAADSAAIQIELILVRVDPALFDWTLAQRWHERRRPSWEVESAPPASAIALNAGQFAHGRPWGWLVADGREVQPPAVGPLSMAFVLDRTHAVHLVPFTAIPALRARHDAILAFQSYPTLLDGDGDVPAPLRAGGRGVNLTHRDSRLAIGQFRDGRLLIVLTRFDTGGGLLRPVPIGPDTPEMAAIMGALGCRTAVMLDGGISSQLLVRAADGGTRLWSAFRWVPLGLVATPRKDSRRAP